MTSSPFERVAILGLGLIGGSLARSMRERSIAKHIAAYDPDSAALTYAQAEGWIDAAHANAADAIADAEVIALCCPPAAFASLLSHIAPQIPKNAVVFDVLSIKSRPMSLAQEILPPGIFFIPCHPIAGSAHSGIYAAQGDLFEKRLVVTTPGKELSHTPQYELITSMWELLGARVTAVDAPTHDAIYACVSHLPQWVAFASAPTFAEFTAADEAMQRFMRLQSSPARLWAQISTMNKEYLPPVCSQFLVTLQHMIGELQSNAQTSETAEPSRLLPALSRVLASCVIAVATTMQHTLKVQLGAFFGAGFHDLTAPTHTPPEEDLAYISEHAASAISLLEPIAQRFKAALAVLMHGTEEELEECFAAWRRQY